MYAFPYAILSAAIFTKRAVSEVSSDDRAAITTRDKDAESCLCFFFFSFKKRTAHSSIIMKPFSLLSLSLSLFVPIFI